MGGGPEQQEGGGGNSSNGSRRQLPSPPPDGAGILGTRINATSSTTNAIPLDILTSLPATDSRLRPFLENIGAKENLQPSAGGGYASCTVEYEGTVYALSLHCRDASGTQPEPRGIILFVAIEGTLSSMKEQVGGLPKTSPPVPVLIIVDAKSDLSKSDLSGQAAKDVSNKHNIASKRMHTH